MKTQSYNRFWQRIHKSAEKNNFPLRVMFELTYRCNFYCRHCYVPLNYRKMSEQKQLKTKEVFSILDQLKNIGCFYLGFTGGEPFIRQDIMDILWDAKRKGFEVIIYTNGSLIDEKIAEELAHLRPNKVDITIPAMSKDSFERIAQIPGSHQKVFNAIDLLYERGVNLGFKTCVLRENEEEIEDIQKFVNSLGALHRLDDMLSRCLDGSDEPFKYRGTLLNTNRHEANANLREYLNEEICVNPREISENSRLFKCGVGRSQVAITPFGELKMCLMIDYPKYKILDNKNQKPKTKNRTQRVNLKEAWQRLKELVKNIRPDENYQCDRCELEPYCMWCPGKGWLDSKGFTSCDLESRAWAETRRKEIKI